MVLALIRMTSERRIPTPAKRYTYSAGRMQPAGAGSPVYIIRGNGHDSV